jgi:hypothetical protein
LHVHDLLLQRTHLLVILQHARVIHWPQLNLLATCSKLKGAQTLRKVSH